MPQPSGGNTRLRANVAVAAVCTPDESEVTVAVNRVQSEASLGEIFKKGISSVLNKFATEQASTKAMEVMAGPVMSNALRTTYVEALKREAAGGAAEYAVIRAGVAATTKGATTLTTLGKVAGPLGGAVVSPLVEVAQVACAEVFKGEARTGEDYKNAAIRGGATGAAGAGASIYCALVFGVLFPPAAPFIALGAGVIASGVTSEIMKQNDLYQ